ncbi:Glutaredoxin [Natronoarchaeum philippinense]|uniref:Glutaredoxin n=1 Tax=Natronoarchaeum philippinense TaxID=558529 RepID=A0A285N6K2_NATPI|nr:glutaredoxin family protein [Natronoarchaeum philippinense]SNZ05092.1 Glutaredoxin [Natronoarchaeum philippinense]
MSDPVPITVYTRENCHLCDDAVDTLTRIAESEGVDIEIEEVDVDDDPELREKYGERVPYVLVDGSPKFKYRVDPAKARSVLSRQ